MGNADPSNLSTISGNMAWKAANPPPSSSSWTPDVSYPTSPSYSGSSQDITGYPGDPGPRASFPATRTRPPRPRVPDWTDRAMQRIPQPVIVACAIVGALIGLGLGASSGGAVAFLYALMGAGAGMLALPAAIKLTQLALRLLAVAAVITVFALILWAVAHSGK